MYGNVPMRLKPGSEAITQGNIEDPWKQILMDLRDAVDLLPAAKSTDGHIDKYAAEASAGPCLVVLSLASLAMVLHWSDPDQH